MDHAERTALRHLVLVPHTHWDREWYETHEQFRMRLVRLIDALLDLLESDPAYRHFTLDGQAIVLDDYLEVRPHARERITKLIEAGRLLVGPWLVLPDEWLVSGEALVRNLRHGMRRAEAAGGSMRLGYVPDQFGHVGQLPQIFVGFGFDAAVLWRGVGSDVDETLFRWSAPDGSSLTAVYLPSGYGNAAHLPRDPVRLARRLGGEAKRLSERSRIPTLLMMNGSDHAAPDPSLPERLAEAASREESDWTYELGTLPGFVERALREVETYPSDPERPSELPHHVGEFRSGLRSPLLPGCASARVHQKQKDFENDRLLTRYLEPLSAWLGALGGDADRELIDFAWRVALENHPHDSICGCSIDAVHDQMDTRFARVREIAEAQLAQVFPALIDRLTGASSLGVGERGNESRHTDLALHDQTLHVWNPNPAGRTPVQAEIELDIDPERLDLPPGLAIRRGGESSPLPAEWALREPGVRVLGFRFPRSLAGAFLDQEYPDMLGYRLQEVSSREAGDTFTLQLHLGRAEGDAHALGRQRAAAAEAMERSEASHVEFLAIARARVGVTFVDELPGFGIQTYRISGTQPNGDGIRPMRRARRAVARSDLRREKLAAGGVAIENRFWRLQADEAGSVSLIRFGDRDHAEAGPSQSLGMPPFQVTDFIRLVSEADRGDEYNFDPLPDAALHSRQTVDTPEAVRVALLRRTPISETLRLRARYRVPVELSRDRTQRSSRTVVMEAEILLRLWAGVDRVDVEVAFDNKARDHRFRIQLRSPFAASRFRVESAFEVAKRPIHPEVSADVMRAERPIGATPQRRFAIVDDGEWGVTVANRGLAEVEAVRGSDEEGRACASLAVTLVRSVGWLSRGDLGVRPVHAGPPFATPGAQVPGPHRAELSVRWHREDNASPIAEAVRFAQPPIALARSARWGDRADAADVSLLLEIDDPLVVVSAIEPRSKGRVLVRVFNACDRERRAALRWKLGDARFRAVDLAERDDPEGQARIEAVGPGAAAIHLRPCQILSLLVEVTG